MKIRKIVVEKIIEIIKNNEKLNGLYKLEKEDLIFIVGVLIFEIVDNQYCEHYCDFSSTEDLVYIAKSELSSLLENVL